MNKNNISFLTIIIIIIVLAFPPFYSKYIEDPSNNISNSNLNLEESHAPSENLTVKGSGYNLLYYSQFDKRWGNEYYGDKDKISLYGCGPTTLAMLVTTLTENQLNPLEMAAWAKDNGYYVQGSGSTHNIIPEGCKSFGINAKPFKEYTVEGLIQELATGNYIVALMNKGTFTAKGHFIILTGVTLDGKLIIADPNSIDNTLELWDPALILKEAKYGANAGGPLWSVPTPYSAKH